MPSGRPTKYKSLKELKKLIDTYFFKCKETEEPLTITGLGLAVGLSRKQLIEYSKRDIFRNTIKEAKQKVEHDYELSLRKNGRAGDIFGLKNFGWKDKTEVDQTVTIKPETWLNEIKK